MGIAWEMAIAWRISIPMLLLAVHGLSQSNDEIDPLTRDTYERGMQQSDDVDGTPANSEDVEHMKRELVLSNQRFKLNRIVEMTKPKTSAQSGTPFNVYTPLWTTWSHWSPCYNNQQMRVRACSAIRGHHCPGENIESKPCRHLESRFQTSFKPLSHGATKHGPTKTFTINGLKEKTSPQMTHTSESKWLSATSPEPTTTTRPKESEDKLVTIPVVAEPPASGRRQQDAVEGWPIPEGATELETEAPLATKPSTKLFEKVAQPPTLDDTITTPTTSTTRQPHASLPLLQPKKEKSSKDKEQQVHDSSRAAAQSRKASATITKNRTVAKPLKMFPEVKLIHTAPHSMQGNNELRVHQASWSSWSAWSICTCKRSARTRTCNYPVDAPLTTGCPGESYELIDCEGTEDAESAKKCIKRAKVI